MELIIGDAVIQNPFSWTVADVDLTFPEGSVSSTDKKSLYAKKPEIKVSNLVLVEVCCIPKKDVMLCFMPNPNPFLLN